MHCFFVFMYEKWFPWECADGHTRSGKGGGGGILCLAHSICAALHGKGLWDLQS